MTVADTFGLEDIVHFLARAMFSVSCHQKPDLLMNVQGDVLPLCIRCGSVYVGLFFAYLVVFLFPGKKLPWLLALVLFGIMIGEWLMAQGGFYASSDWTRGVTGFVGGFGAANILWCHGKGIGSWPVIVPVVVPALVSLTSPSLAVLVLILTTWAIFWGDVVRRTIEVVASYRKRS